MEVIDLKCFDLEAWEQFECSNGVVESTCMVGVCFINVKFGRTDCKG